METINQINAIHTLVVDDSEDECTLLEYELRALRFVKLLGFVHDGEEAIEYLRGTGKFEDRKAFPYPDLLLLDFNMPWCGGIEVLKFLQQEPRRPRVILWSGDLHCINMSPGLRVGVDLICKKPANGRELEEIFQRLEAKTIKAVSAPAPAPGARIEL